MTTPATCPKDMFARADHAPATVIIAVIDTLHPLTRISIFATRVEHHIVADRSAQHCTSITRKPSVPHWNQCHSLHLPWRECYQTVGVVPHAKLHRRRGLEPDRLVITACQACRRGLVVPRWRRATRAKRMRSQGTADRGLRRG